MKNTETLYAITELVRALVPLALIATGGAIAFNTMNLANLSADKLALIIGFAGPALTATVTGACAMHNPQIKERNQPQTRVGHIDQVDIEQTVEEDKGESENQGRGGGDVM